MLYFSSNLSFYLALFFSVISALIFISFFTFVRVFILINFSLLIILCSSLLRGLECIMFIIEKKASEGTLLAIMLIIRSANIKKSKINSY